MNIKYIIFSEVDPVDFLVLLNKQKLREHLIQHDLFDIDSINDWIKAKLEVDSEPGCRVRAILFNDNLVGWCGIQFENDKYEIAIIIDDSLWGAGKRIYTEVMCWAKELGHDEVVIHLLDSRPEYKFLRKIAKNVYKSELLGREFITYQLLVK